MTQYNLIKTWLEEKGTITPAKMAGTIYYGVMFGSETSKRCRELRKKNILESYSQGKFEVFKLKSKPITLHIEIGNYNVSYPIPINRQKGLNI